MAILLYELGLLNKSTIYATDMNDLAIKKAKIGSFPLKKMRDYTYNYVKSGGINDFSQYYIVSKDEAVFQSYLSKNIVFAQHNLVTDGSINEFHLIICRNVLIYFNLELQDRVHQLIYDSLSPGGFLGLGTRECLNSSKTENGYKSVDELEKIYKKIE